MSTDLMGIKALVCDVFGTVVDWRSSIIREGEQLAATHGLQVDWARFADAWRGGYRPAMERVGRGEWPWLTIDQLHRTILDELLHDFQIVGLSATDIEQFNRVWHRLAPWPDAVAGLTRLRTRYIVATLSNGNVALLTSMAKHAGLPWDCILSAELVRQYKPAPAVYQMAADLLGLVPAQVLMVAAHTDDLRAASRVGLRTAFVPRPLEFGSQPQLSPASDRSFDIVASDFHALAAQLGI